MVRRHGCGGVGPGQRKEACALLFPEPVTLAPNVQHMTVMQEGSRIAVAMTGPPKPSPHSVKRLLDVIMWN